MSVQKIVFILATVVAIVLGITVFAVLGNGNAGPSKQALQSAGIVLLPQTRELPKLELINEQGQKQTLESLKGRWTLVFFGYTFCPDVCPTTLGELRQLLRKLPPETRDKIQVLMVSVDPNRDTPEQLKNYLAYYQEGYKGFTGTLEQIQTLANALSIPFIPADTSKPNYTVDHSANLALLGPFARQKGFIRAPLNIDKLAEVLPQLVNN